MEQPKQWSGTGAHRRALQRPGTSPIGGRETFPQVRERPRPATAHGNSPPVLFPLVTSVLTQDAKNENSIALGPVDSTLSLPLLKSEPTSTVSLLKDEWTGLQTELTTPAHLKSTNNNKEDSLEYSGFISLAVHNAESESPNMSLQIFHMTKFKTYCIKQKERLTSIMTKKYLISMHRY